MASLWEMGDLETPWCIRVVATLRVADHIAAGHCEVRELAAAAGADAETLGRVLRHLASKGVFEEPATGRFELNAMARELLGEGRLVFDLNGFGGRMTVTWNALLFAVKTGRTGYAEVFGKSFWDDLDANPEIAAEFDALMGPAGHGVPHPEVLFDPANWASIRTVVDVGGGTGALLAEVLKAHPHLRGTLVDMPRTVARAEKMERMTLIGQSFFDPLPAGHDLYLIKNVLADWPDAEAAQILKRMAEAARPAGRIMILGGVSGGKAASPELLMLVLVGGKDRTLEEFGALAGGAGLTIHASGRLASGRFAVECRPR